MTANPNDKYPIPNPRAIPEFLHNKDLRLIMFGGKGGVGKTTLAAAAALHLADTYQGSKKILIISTDPAHSLSDSFQFEIGDQVTAVQKSEVRDQRSEVSNLFAMELNAARLLKEFKEAHGEVIRTLADRGTYFDRADIASFLDLSLPGIDEVMAVIHMAELIRKKTFDLLILDTAPTGHTVRMLALPEQMKKWIHLLDLMQQKYRYMATHFTNRKYMDDACDTFIKDLSHDIDAVVKLLRNGQITRFVPVTIPEPMAVNETKRLNHRLVDLSVPVKEILINRVAEHHDCSLCRARQAAQKPSLALLQQTFPNHGLIRVPLLAQEIGGVEGLQALGDYLGGGPVPSVSTKEDRQDPRPKAYLTWNPSLEFYLFGGKGGVGKTTLAAATALYLSEIHRDKKVLLFSTDPAHSLSDSLNQPIGDEITAVQEAAGREQRAGTSDIGPRTSDINLFAVEINGDKLFEAYKATFESEIKGVFNRFVESGMDIKFDREVMTQLLSLAPPGLDEIMALDRIMDLRTEEAFDILILDTSPTGHLLRFLELPDMVREWLNAFFRLLLKYKGVVKLTEMAEKALALSKNVRRIQETLTDPAKTGFVAVTIAEAMGVSELKRLMSAVDRAGISCDNIAVNRVTPRSSCPFCTAKRGMEQNYIQKIIEAFPSTHVAEVPLFEKDIQGVQDLKQVGDILFP